MYKDSHAQSFVLILYVDTVFSDTFGNVDVESADLYSLTLRYRNRNLKSLKI